MLKLNPLRALRPRADVAEQVASVPSRGVTPVQVTEHSDRWLDLINAMHEVRHH